MFLWQITQVEWGQISNFCTLNLYLPFLQLDKDEPLSIVNGLPSNLLQNRIIIAFLNIFKIPLTYFHIL